MVLVIDNRIYRSMDGNLSEIHEFCRNVVFYLDQVRKILWIVFQPTEISLLDVHPPQSNSSAKRCGDLEGRRRDKRLWVQQHHPLKLFGVPIRCFIGNASKRLRAPVNIQGLWLRCGREKLFQFNMLQFLFRWNFNNFKWNFTLHCVGDCTWNWTQFRADSRQ